MNPYLFVVMNPFWAPAVAMLTSYIAAGRMLAVQLEDVREAIR